MSTLAIGIMSGTSLDGIDISLCRFSESGINWKFEIIDAQTVSYSNLWIEKLRNAHLLAAYEFLLLHNEYGNYIGKLIQEFLRGKEIPQLIASHGHTIFHQPNKKLTFQLGNGASIAAITGISTISNFRNFDVSLGGKGAPLVLDPIPSCAQRLRPARKSAGTGRNDGQFPLCRKCGGLCQLAPVACLGRCQD